VCLHPVVHDFESVKAAHWRCVLRREKNAGHPARDRKLIPDIQPAIF
jgi:hypothetical protein